MEALLNDISPKSDHAISWLKALLSIYLFIHHPYNETGYPAEEKKKVFLFIFTQEWRDKSSSHT